jgi:hypothetical protein
MNRTPMLRIGYGEAKAGEGALTLVMPFPLTRRGLRSSRCEASAFFKRRRPKAAFGHPLPQGEREEIELSAQVANLQIAFPEPLRYPVVIDVGRAGLISLQNQREVVKPTPSC